MSDDQSSSKSSYSDRLNKARIEDSVDMFSTPSRSKSRAKKKRAKSREYNWEQDFTRSISKQSSHSTPSMEIKNTYKSDGKTATAYIIKKNGVKYHNICPICLSEFQEDRGRLVCEHQFCLQCIMEWSKTSTNCPCCRRIYSSIAKVANSTVKERIQVQQKEIQFDEYDYYICYACNLGDNENVLLICDACDFYCCHIYCDPELRNIVPEDDWFCAHCRNRIGRDRRATREINNRQNESNAIDPSQAPTVSDNQQSNDSESEDSPEKGVASRTRSREQRFSNLRRNNLQTLRNIRRRR